MPAGGERDGVLFLMIIAAALAIGIVRSYNPGYHFDGMIGQEHVIFSEDILGKNYLEVTKDDGSVVTYFDTQNNDFRLEGVTVGDGEDSRTYSRNIPSSFQREFDSYLEEIANRSRA